MRESIRMENSIQELSLLPRLKLRCARICGAFSAAYTAYLISIFLFDSSANIVFNPDKKYVTKNNYNLFCITSLDKLITLTCQLCKHVNYAKPTPCTGLCSKKPRPLIKCPREPKQQEKKCPPEFQNPRHALAIVLQSS